jgi:hypothetical protein
MSFGSGFAGLGLSRSLVFPIIRVYLRSFAVCLLNRYGLSSHAVPVLREPVFSTIPHVDFPLNGW